MRSNEGGFTLVELMIAIGVGVVFIISVTTLTINSDRIGHRTRTVATANSFAENKIEALRSVGYLSLSNGTTDITSQLPSELKAPRSASLVIATAPGMTAVKKIDLSITYNEQGRPRTYSYTTFEGELGVGQQ